MNGNAHLLELRDLRTWFHTEEGVAKAVDGVSWSLPRGRTLALVGESGCGKSVTALSIMRLIPDPPGRIVDGRVLFQGRDLIGLSDREMRKVRGGRISMIFQEPMTSLDPVFTVGHEIAEAIQLHQGLHRDGARDQALESLKMVGMPDAEKRLASYPHELSGGMRQRAMIAMALSCNPALLIADEPTTALDVTIQAQILELIDDLKDRLGTSVILITHDLGVVAEMCDDVAVMYAGHLVEHTDVHTLFETPLHPYTQALQRSIPRLDADVGRLDTIEGLVPSLRDIPPGCPFHPRCPHRFERCPVEMPALYRTAEHHQVKCHLYDPKDFRGTDLKEDGTGS